MRCIVKKMTSFTLLSECILSMGLMCAVAAAQMNVAEVTGVVADPAGGVVAHASVTAVNAESQATFVSFTDDAGHYHLAPLPPGDYSLKVSAEGFQQAVEPHVTLHAGDRASQAFRLAVGQKTQVLVVEGVPGLLQTESAQVRAG
jgi:Carboxypeptidase regulatory-like domain